MAYSPTHQTNTVSFGKARVEAGNGPPPTDLQRSFTIAVVMAIAIGTALRLTVALRLPLWLDEGFQWASAQQTVRQLLRGTLDDALSVLLTKFTVALFGQNPLAFRLHSVVFGILCIPLAAWLGRRIASPMVGIFSAWLTAVDPLLVWNDSLARMYGLWGFLLFAIACSMAGICRGLGPGVAVRKREWLFLGILLAMSLWTHRLSAYAWVAVAAAVLGNEALDGFRAASWRRFLDAVKGLALTYGFAVALSVPRIYCILREVKQSLSPDHRRECGPDPYLTTLGLSHALGEFAFTNAYLILLAVAFAGLIVLYRREPKFSRYLLLVAALSILGAHRLATLHFAVGRYLYPLFIPVCLGISVFVVAFGGQLARLSPRLGRLTIAVLVLAVGVRMAQVGRFLTEQDDPGVAAYEGSRLLQYLREFAGSEDTLVTISPHIQNLASFYGVPAHRQGARWDGYPKPDGYGYQAEETPLGAGRNVWIVTESQFQSDFWIETTRKQISSVVSRALGRPIPPQSADELAKMNLIRIRDGKIWAAKSLDVLRSGNTDCLLAVRGIQ